MTVPFDVEHVVYGLIVSESLLWCGTHCTLCLCLLCCCLSRASINCIPNRFKMRHAVGSKNHLTSVGRALLKRESIDLIVIAGTL